MTVKPVRAASVPPVMNRNSVTGAVPAKNSPGARSIAMPTKVRTTIKASLMETKNT